MMVVEWGNGVQSLDGCGGGVRRWGDGCGSGVVVVKKMRAMIMGL